MREDKMICQGIEHAIERAMRTDSTPALTALENEHVAACDACTDLLLTHLLHRKPEVAIPPEFAARVRSQLPETYPAKAPRTVPAYGLTTAVVVLMALAVAWSALNYFDPRWWTLSGTLSLVLESVVTLEIGGIALWLGTRRSTS